jgi:hypothetical protein
MRSHSGEGQPTASDAATRGDPTVTTNRADPDAGVEGTTNDGAANAGRGVGSGAVDAPTSVFRDATPDHDRTGSRTIRVRLENVARVEPGDGYGAAPTLAPGAYAVHSQPGVLFEVGQAASDGLAALARDGRPGELAAELAADERVTDAGTLATPAGADRPRHLAPGEAYDVTVDASPGDRLSVATTVGRSVDAVYAPSGGGIDLFRGDEPLVGDATDRLAAWAVGNDRAHRTAAADAGADRVVPALFGFEYPGVCGAVRLTLTPT